jgi:hypothetical protein
MRDRSTCQRCMKSPVSQNNPMSLPNPGIGAHHIFSRRHMGTRHDPENGISLCFYCHIRIAHGEPELFRSFILKRMGQNRYDALMIRAYAICKEDLMLAKIALEGLLKEVV